MEIRENTLRYKLKKKLPPLLIALLVVYLVWLAFGSMLPGLLPLLREGDEQQIAQYLAEQQGAKGIISVILLSGIQVVSVVLPGLAIQIASGLIYGWKKGFLMCYTGFVIANTLVFAFAKRMGGDRMDKITIDGRGRKFLESIRSTPPRFMVAILNMVPAIPNGIIPYLAAQMGISLPEYVQAVMAGSFLQILIGCMAGNFIMHGDWLYMVLTFALQVLLIVIILWKRELFIAKSRELFAAIRAFKQKKKEELKQNAAVRREQHEQKAQERREQREQQAQEKKEQREKLAQEKKEQREKLAQEKKEQREKLAQEKKEQREQQAKERQEQREQESTRHRIQEV